MTELKKTGWGGPRPGAGRPRSADGQTIAVYVRNDLAEAVRRQAAERQESLSAYFCGALEARVKKEDRKKKTP